MAKLECNICHEYGVSGKSRRTLLNTDYTQAPWWTLNFLLNPAPRWVHVLLFFACPIIAAAVTSLLPPLFHRNDLPIDAGSVLLVLALLVLSGAGEIHSRFWQRRLGLRRGMFHRYQCRSCSSHWEWVEVSPQRTRPDQAGRTEPQPTEPVSPVAAAPFDS